MWHQPLGLVKSSPHTGFLRGSQPVEPLLNTSARSQFTQLLFKTPRLMAAGGDLSSYIKLSKLVALGHVLSRAVNIAVQRLNQYAGNGDRIDIGKTHSI